MIGHSNMQKTLFPFLQKMKQSQHLNKNEKHMRKRLSDIKTVEKTYGNDDAA